MKHIQMIGIDHTHADVEIRELFSFTKKAAAEAMEQLKKQPGISGCVLIATCNRVELYINGEGEESPLPLLDIFCRLRNVDAEKSRPYFTLRDGEEAVHHLFLLTAGLESRIFGEDQILTQVGDALAQSREVYASDTVLEVLFRHAVTAAKKVKTQVKLDRENISAAHLALERLKEQGFSPEGKTCMVIGNGMMGKIAAQVFKEAGADVTVTVRQYKSGHVEIPEGCKRIHYGERYDRLPFCDLVCSATASPNVTLTEEQVRKACTQKPLICLDLAVPRDIDPEVGKIPGVRLYDIDDFSIDRFSDRMKEQYAQAEEILSEAEKEYRIWLAGRSLLPAVQSVGEKNAADLDWRLTPQIRKNVEEARQEQFHEAVKTAAQKVVNRMLFRLRDGLEPEEFAECIKILEESE